MESPAPEQDTSRKRAAVACNYCRRRKRRCDGRKPVCTLCDEANIDCAYNDPETRRSESFNGQEYLNRLGDLETLIRENSEAIASIRSQLAAPPPLPAPSPYSPQSSRDAFSVQTPQPSNNVTAAAFLQASPQNDNSYGRNSYSPAVLSHTSEQGIPAMTIPIGHATTIGSLLTSPQMRGFLGHFPNDLFRRVESQRKLPREILLSPVLPGPLQFPQLDRVRADQLVEVYFSEVNPQHPVLDYDSFLLLHRSVLDQGLQFNLETAISLAVLALGEAVSTPLDIRDDHGNWTPGSQYLTVGWQILRSHFYDSFDNSIYLPQGLCLCALYFAVLARPLQASKLVHSASTSLQELLMQLKTPASNGPERQQILRIAWCIFDLECDLLAEHHLPRSGIEEIVDTMPFPSYGDSPDHAMLAWLSELSIRKLLNRVHHAMYAADWDKSPQASLSPGDGRIPHDEGSFRPLHQTLKVSAELSRQLESWFNLLPPEIKPDMRAPLPSNRIEAAILCRYHSAREIIFRPFVFYAIGLKSRAEMDDFVADCCEKCISSSRAYVDFAEVVLEKPSASTEIDIQSVFASTAILTIAFLNPALRYLVHDLEKAQESAIKMVQRWAFPGSCIESILSILKLMREKTAMFGQFTSL